MASHSHSSWFIMAPYKSPPLGTGDRHLLLLWCTVRKPTFRYRHAIYFDLKVIGNFAQPHEGSWMWNWIFGQVFFMHKISTPFPFFALQVESLVFVDWLLGRDPGSWGGHLTPGVWASTSREGKKDGFCWGGLKTNGAMKKNWLFRVV